MKTEVDILENDILKHPILLDILLSDHSSKKNILWATDNYKDFGEAYQSTSHILPELITGDHEGMIMPRVKKDKLTQQSRSRDMAEVFTPSWICNAQNNLIDRNWFGRDVVFNKEMIINQTHIWEVYSDRIIFPDHKNWIDYVKETRLEITCGEAPYITSRYDTTTGEFIPVDRRIGLLDRKLRIVNENVHDVEEWLKYTKNAYQHIYAFEWQGDNLLLAREAMLATFFENYRLKFSREPAEIDIIEIAQIISWNVWQMDGLKGVVPNSCRVGKKENVDLFGEISVIEEKCEGCVKEDIKKHNGIVCKIRDWDEGKNIKFINCI